MITYYKHTKVVIITYHNHRHATHIQRVAMMTSYKHATISTSRRRAFRESHITNILQIWLSHITNILNMYNALRLSHGTDTLIMCDYHIIRPRSFLDPGFQPRVHSFVWFVPLSPNWVTFRFSPIRLSRGRYLLVFGGRVRYPLDLLSHTQTCYSCDHDMLQTCYVHTDKLQTYNAHEFALTYTPTCMLTYAHKYTYTEPHSHIRLHLRTHVRIHSAILTYPHLPQLNNSFYSLQCFYSIFTRMPPHHACFCWLIQSRAIISTCAYNQPDRPAHAKLLRTLFTLIGHA